MKNIKNAQEIKEMLETLNKMVEGKLIIQRFENGELALPWAGTPEEAVAVFEVFEPMKTVFLSSEEVQQQAVIEAIGEDYIQNADKNNYGLKIKALLSEEEDLIWDEMGPRIAEYMKNSKNNSNKARLLGKSKEIKKAVTKQQWVNKLGEELTHLFLTDYGYIDYDPEFIPEEIEFGNIKLHLAVNGHKDCPRYNSQIMYIGEIEEHDIQIWVEYYRGSVFHTIQIMPAYEGPEYHFEPYEYIVPKHDIIETMKELMMEEL
ncbi:TPA: hypothetical protein QCX12_002344 [Bacillus paranthracis]|nr:hypothetical protein [Bacillus paranthracis]HDR7523511.1 hypothetical protein [Bacillus paranthracis]